jgi:hypothetical protein
MTTDDGFRGEARSLLKELGDVAAGHTAGAIFNAVLNLLAATIVEGSESLEEAEEGVDVVREQLVYAVNEHWKGLSVPGHG